MFATVVVAIALLVGATTVVLLQRRSMIEDVDTSALNRAMDLASLVRSGALPETVAVGKEQDAFAQVVDANGRVVAASQNVTGEPPIVRRAAPARSVRTMQVLALDDEFRIADLRTSSLTGPVTVVVGESLQPIEDATGALVTLLVIGIPLLLIVVAGTTWVVTGRALRPVAKIRAEVASISEQGLHRRVPEPAAHDEIRDLAMTMDQMLGRLEDAYARQARFVSDASHELQTPVAALRARLEVDLAHPHRADVFDTEREALADVTGLQRLVEDLLVLARLPTDTEKSPREVVDLDDVVLREAQRIRTRGRVGVDLRGVSSGQVDGALPQLQRVIRNLLDNAERHAKSTITLSVAERDDAVEVLVTDDGPGIPSEARDRIFERFARLDDARTPQGAGTGLGLAIAREIVQAHGGTLTVEDGSPGARFVTRLPRAKELA
jgi:signal transduction histidine kinase